MSIFWPYQCCQRQSNYHDYLPILVVRGHCFVAKTAIKRKFSSNQKTVATTDHLDIQLWEAPECQAQWLLYEVGNAEYNGERAAVSFARS